MSKIFDRLSSQPEKPFAIYGGLLGFAYANYQEITCPDLTSEEQIGIGLAILKIFDITCSPPGQGEKIATLRQKVEQRLTNEDLDAFDLSATIASTQNRPENNPKPNILEGLQWLQDQQKTNF